MSPHTTHHRATCRQGHGGIMSAELLTETVAEEALKISNLASGRLFLPDRSIPNGNKGDACLEAAICMSGWKLD